MKRIIKRIITVFLVLIFGFVGAFTLMILGIQRSYEDIMPLNLAEIQDGAYRGKAGSFIVSADLNVVVKDHRIADIVMIEQNCGGNYKALDTIPRILERQEAKVDAVSGATWSSKAIMSAAYNALE